MEMNIEASAYVLLCKMRCMLFFMSRQFLCAVSERNVRSFFSVSFSVEDPYLCMPSLVRLDYL